MQIPCPVCSKILELPESSSLRHSGKCPFCHSDFFLAGDLAFRYGDPLAASPSHKYRVSCPYCGQHYNLTDPVMYNMLGCQKCLKIFIIPPGQRPEEAERISTLPLPAPIPMPDPGVSGKEKREKNIGQIPPSPPFPATLQAPRTPAIHVVSLPAGSQKEWETLVPEALDVTGKPLKKEETFTAAVDLPLKKEETSGNIVDFPFKKEEPPPLSPGSNLRLREVEKEEDHGKQNMAEKAEKLPKLPVPPPETFQNKSSHNSRKIRIIPDQISPEDETALFMDTPERNTGKKNAKPTKNKGEEKDKKIRRIAGNILWLFCGGLPHALLAGFWGGIFCITIIGIPLGLQLFKVAKLYLSPFGAQICQKDEGKIGCLITGGNILWLILFGWLMALGNLLWGGILFCTVIGIPFALQYFKLAKLVLTPFGKEVQWKANWKELLLCILAVFFIQAVVIPSIISGIRNALIRTAVEQRQKADHQQQKNGKLQMEDAVLEEE